MFCNKAAFLLTKGYCVSAVFPKCDLNLCEGVMNVVLSERQSEKLSVFHNPDTFLGGNALLQCSFLC